ncbi:MAG: ARMT1-like domain-containing protein [Candidatus Aegiribacteria sp.]|nr:ARMT1-like domain-containing protein [Candidatus Aegiribacteria sp.]
MKAELECLPCLVRQAREVAIMSTNDSSMQKKIMRSCFAYMSETDLDRSPPEIAQGIGRIVRSMTGIDDPYRNVKSIHTAAALEMLPEMEKIVTKSDDPFVTGLRLAIAGNIIDLGAKEKVSDNDISGILNEAMHLPLYGADPRQLKAEIDKADSVLYLADNAGETVFDRVFLEQFTSEKVTVAVRGAPAINDATLYDAKEAGLDRVARLIDNGSGAPATVLSDCSPEFIDIFKKADVIIAKGQGNYESLSSSDANIFFLFRVKCDLVAEHSGFPVGSLVLLKASDG